MKDAFDIVLPKVCIIVIGVCVRACACMRACVYCINIFT